MKIESTILIVTLALYEDGKKIRTTKFVRIQTNSDLMLAGEKK